MAEGARKGRAGKAKTGPARKSVRKAAKAQKKPKPASKAKKALKAKAARTKPRPKKTAKERKPVSIRHKPRARKKAAAPTRPKAAMPVAARPVAPRPKPQPAQSRALLIQKEKSPLPAQLPPAALAQKGGKPAKPPPPHLDASTDSNGPLAIPLIPALDLLPEWEDRLRLKRAIFEGGLSFFSLGRNCPEYHEAGTALSRSKNSPQDSVPGYFMVCIKDRSGRMVGAMDGHMLGNGLLSIGRSCALGQHRRQTHILLYCAALSGHEPSYVLFSMKKGEFTSDDAARLILLGRGLGFSILPLSVAGRMFFIRRVRRELDPISSGQELAQAISPASPLYGEAFEKSLAELAAKGILPLAPLPASPDSREHLHELRDAIAALGIRAEGLDAVLETLRIEYVLGRKDLTPESLS